METRQIKPGTIILLALLVIGLIAVAIQLPALNREKQRLQTEAAATPTPTADIRSMMAVTPEPGATPRPTELLLKPGVAGDEVTRLQQRLSQLGYYTGELTCNIS